MNRCESVHPRRFNYHERNEAADRRDSEKTTPSASTIPVRRRLCLSAEGQGSLVTPASTDARLDAAEGISKLGFRYVIAPHEAGPSGALRDVSAATLARLR
jgi:hypothetical protein